MKERFETTVDKAQLLVDKFTSMTPGEAVLEAVVVTGVVARVAWSLWYAGSLFCEAAGLVLLTAVAIGMEFFYGKDKLLVHLKPRSCISSGFLLGAITLPVVLSSRLVQLIRCSEPSEVSGLALDRLKIEFWLSLACSSSMLMLLIGFLRKHCRLSWFISTGLEYAIVGLLIALTPKSTLDTSGIGLWIAVYVLGGKALFRAILRVFPNCGTVGEVMLVVEGIVLCGANAAAWSLKPLKKVATNIHPERHVTMAFLQGVILGVLLVPLLFEVIFRVLPYIVNRPSLVKVIKRGSRAGFHVIYRAGLFYVVLSVVLFTVTPLYVGSVVGVRHNPVRWALDFVLQQPGRRLLLCGYWGAICTLLPVVYRISATGQVPNIIIRKLFHVMIVFMFVPALVLDPGFLEVAFGVALAGFLVVEMIRVWALPPFGYFVGNYMKNFTDHRDSGILIISHFSLLLGCALPVWLNSGETLGDRPMASFAGILSLGVGDTMASVIGYNFGSIRVSSKSKKTLEGTASGIISVLVALLLLLPILEFLTLAKPTLAEDYVSLVFSTIAVGLLEAYTLHLDNAFIPLLFYSLLCL